MTPSEEAVAAACDVIYGRKGGARREEFLVIARKAVQAAYDAEPTLCRVLSITPLDGAMTAGATQPTLTSTDHSDTSGCGVLADSHTGEPTDLAAENQRLRQALQDIFNDSWNAWTIRRAAAALGGE